MISYALTEYRAEITYFSYLCYNTTSIINVMNIQKYLGPAVFPDVLLCGISRPDPTEGVCLRQPLQVSLVHHTECGTEEPAESAVECMVL